MFKQNHPLPHPATQNDDGLGGRVGERAGQARQRKLSIY